ncbi:hypothetical protein ACTFQF_16440 [Aliivibrio fischeri]|uniref:hypothetical protein n=1 Tax=Aliivibrio fischeri TaxID=668 RepID=UPI0007C5A051|nr:hypothetical protein [Aliivibrio fischeri]MBP3140223.1 hypothetical protein [Aliivibrio fischeri]MBP3154608.1 hypothetical protein [Aliivibrio fischeri]MCE7575762.1 hypothetical protein [Aliivibrio fischeri]
MFRRIGVIVALLSLAGCAGSPTYQKPIPKKFSYPPLEREVIISLGENLLRQGLSSKVRAVDVYNEVSISLATLMPNNYIQTGFVGNSKERAIFQPENKGPAFSGTFSSAMFVVDEKANLACLYDPAMGLLLEATDCSNLDVLKEQGRIYDKNLYDSSAFQQTLIYTGKIDNRIRFTYREFSGSTARMPFSTDVEYDLNEGNVISYQGATIEVIKANNRSITYKVISNFRNYE